MPNKQGKVIDIQEEKSESKDAYTLTNGEIDALMSNEGTAELSPLNIFIRLITISISVAFELEKLANILQPISAIINNQKIKLIEKYGQRDGKGNLIQQGPNMFSIKNLAWFNKELNELMSIENKIEWEKIMIDRDQDLPRKGISTRDIMVMRKVVDFVKTKDGKQELA